MSAGSRLRSDRGLVGKLLLLWLVLAALLVAVGIDAGTILLARYHAADAAQDASFQASSQYQRSGDRRSALQAAVEVVRQKDPGAKVSAFAVDPSSGTVTVTVSDSVSTLLAGRFGFTRELTTVTATDTSEPPAP